MADNRNSKSFDIAIIGGGLAGLAAGIFALELGWSVVVFEKKTYPFHKVCGEYLSQESFSLLQHLQVPFEDWQLPNINCFAMTTANNRRFEAKLPLGGIGVSRNRLDCFLAEKLIEKGGVLHSDTKVTGIKRQPNTTIIYTANAESNGLESKVLIGSFGRNTPVFMSDNEKNKPAQTHIGVKYHIRADLPKNLIELHHFPGGYCGISAIEEDKYCFCYLLNDQISKSYKGDLESVEENMLAQNPTLLKYLTDYERVTPRVSTGGVLFSPGKQVFGNSLLIGDAAGMIPPLAGNGMSMALHSAVLAINAIDLFLTGKQSEKISLQKYQAEWNSVFAVRLRMARRLQSAMENPWITEAVLAGFQWFPGLFRLSVKSTHGIQIPLPERIKT